MIFFLHGERYQRMSMTQFECVLPAGLLLVLQCLLGVVAGPGGELHSTLYMGVNPGSHGDNTETS